MFKTSGLLQIWHRITKNHKEITRVTNKLSKTRRKNITKSLHLIKYNIGFIISDHFMDLRLRYPTEAGHMLFAEKTLHNGHCTRLNLQQDIQYLSPTLEAGRNPAVYSYHQSLKNTHEVPSNYRYYCQYYRTSAGIY